MIHHLRFGLVISALVALEAITCQIQLAQSAEVGDDPLSQVVRRCKEKLDIKSIAEFNKFIDQYKDVVEENAVPSGGNKWIEKCWSEKEAILALAELVKSYDRKRACKMDNVMRLDQYARKYIQNNTRSIVLKFFTLFGVNIAIKCKINILAHLKQADLEVDQLDFVYSMASPTGWNVLVNEYTKKSMKFGASSNIGGNLINRVAKLVPGLNQVDELEFMNFNHIMNEQTVAKETGSYTPEQVAVLPKLRDSMIKIIQSCKDLDQFYYNSVLSLAKLTELGLMVNFLNDHHESSHLLHKWIAATSFCQLMVRVTVTDSTSSIDFEIVHDDNAVVSRQKVYSYVCEWDEIVPEAVSSVWQASVPEGKWTKKKSAIFRPGMNQSMAKMRLLQFMLGLDRDFAKSNSVSTN